jgi:hypothetical protein
MHDYQISWDYMLDDYVEGKHLYLLKRLIKDIKVDTLPLLKAFKIFEVYPIILPDRLLGVYCLGTSSRPIIGVDIGNILIACEEYNNISLELALKTTILHELKHAWQEWNNKELDEVEAEDFAYAYA